MIPFKEFKERALEKAAKNIYNELRDHLSKDISQAEFIEFVKKAADAAEKIVEEKKRRAGGTGFQPIDGDLENIPEFVETIRMITKMMPEEYLGTPQKPKFPETKKAVKEPKGTSTPENIALEARKLLGILSGLKFANYSNDAVQNAIRSLELEVERLSENPVENLELVGLYCLVIRALEKGDFEEAEELLKGLSGR